MGQQSAIVSPEEAVERDATVATKPKKFKAHKEYDEMLRQRALQLADPRGLGLSLSDKDEMVNQATLQATQQAAVNQRAINQAALAGQGFQAGQFAEASQRAGDVTAQAGSEASAAASELSQQLIEARSAQIRQELAIAAEQKRQRKQYWGTMGLKALQKNILPGASLVEGGLGGGGDGTELSGGTSEGVA